MPKISRTLATIGVASLILVNLIALNWSWRFFQRQDGSVLLRYGDRIPAVEGRSYAGRSCSLDPSRFNLVLYLSGARLSGRSLSVLKFCDLLHRETGKQRFEVTLATRGTLREVRELVDDYLISYRVINDSEGTLANRLGLNADESGTFLFDSHGLCRFATRQLVNQDDLRQLFASKSVTGDEDLGHLISPRELSKGKPLPSWRLLDARSLNSVTMERLRHASTTLVFFIVDCFSCGAPTPKRYLAEFNHWRKLR